jgi:hypothetical protein
LALMIMAKKLNTRKDNRLIMTIIGRLTLKFICSNHLKGLFFP